MAGIYKLYVVGGEGGFMGTDGVNPIEYILAVGAAQRIWFEVIDHRRRNQLSTVRVTVPAGPHDPDALIDAVLAFDLGRFAECPSFANVRDQLEGVDRLEFDCGLNVPPSWARLREEARPIFARMGIWEAELREVRKNG